MVGQPDYKTYARVPVFFAPLESERVLQLDTHGGAEPAFLSKPARPAVLGKQSFGQPAQTGNAQIEVTTIVGLPLLLCKYLTIFSVLQIGFHFILRPPSDQ